MNGCSVSGKYAFSGLRVQLNEVCKRFSNSHCDLFDKSIEENIQNEIHFQSYFIRILALDGMLKCGTESRLKKRAA